MRLLRSMSLEGHLIDADCLLEYEESDWSVGISGGWYLVEAVLGDHAAVCDRDEFEVLFGRQELDDVELAAADRHWSECEDPDA